MSLKNMKIIFIIIPINFKCNIKIINEMKGVVRIHNQIRIGSVTSVTTQTNDIWLTSKVKTALFSSEKINAKDNEAYFTSLTNKQVIFKMLEELSLCYRYKRDDIKADEVQHLMHILVSDSESKEEDPE